MEQPRTLVMSLAVGYPLPVFQIFVDTLRSTGYAGAIALVVGEEVPEPVAAYCREQRVELTPRLSVGLVNRTVAATTMHDNSGLEHPQFTRFKAYSKICLASSFDACFATDFRDVVFQSDPFRTATLSRQMQQQQPHPWLVVESEHENRTLTNCGVNKYWVRVCYGRIEGPKMLAGPLLDKHVLCSGTIFGNPSGFRALAHAFKSTRCRGSRDGIDQGVLNALVYTNSTLLADGGVPARVSVEPPGEGAVVTLSMYKLVAHEVPLDAAGRVLNRDGAPASIVHQYDRFVLNGYGPSIRFGALDARDPVPCQVPAVCVAHGADRNGTWIGNVCRRVDGGKTFGRYGYRGHSGGSHNFLKMLCPRCYGKNYNGSFACHRWRRSEVVKHHANGVANAAGSKLLA